MQNIPKKKSKEEIIKSALLSGVLFAVVMVFFDRFRDREFSWVTTIVRLVLYVVIYGAWEFYRNSKRS